MANFQDVIRRAWTDETFKNRLLADPKSALAEVGQQIPESIAVKVHVNSSDELNFVLMEKGQIEGTKLEELDPVIGKVTNRAWEDSAFKAKLLNDPKAAIQEVTGLVPPASWTVNIYENTPTMKHLVIPVKPPTSGELSDADLEQVAGGGKGAAFGGSCEVSDTEAGTIAGEAALETILGVVALAIGWSWGWSAY